MLSILFLLNLKNSTWNKSFQRYWWTVNTGYKRTSAKQLSENFGGLNSCAWKSPPRAWQEQLLSIPPVPALSPYPTLCYWHPKQEWDEILNIKSPSVCQFAPDEAGECGQGTSKAVWGVQRKKLLAAPSPCHCRTQDSLLCKHMEYSPGFQRLNFQHLKLEMLSPGGRGVPRGSQHCHAEQKIPFLSPPWKMLLLVPVPPQLC